MKNVLRSTMLSIVFVAGAPAQAQPASPTQAAQPPQAAQAAQSAGAVQPDQDLSTPDIRDLGGQRYRVGDIEIDKARGLFTVAGQVLRDEPPLEFLVVTKGGRKAYEAVLEVDADAFEFNLACILIGLESDRATPWEERTAEALIEGDPVEIKVSWLDGEERVTVSGSDLLVAGEPPEKVESHDWVYTGSAVLNDGRYLANLSGTLIGFVHRAETVIEHKQGIGFGNYGSVTVNSAKAPPVGTKIELQVRRLRSAKKSN